MQHLLRRKEVYTGFGGETLMKETSRKK